MTRALLDVNVLLASIDNGHQHHHAAQDWLAGSDNRGWASCPITENGFVRILSQPRYPRPISLSHAVALLRDAQRHPSHEFWPCDVSLLDARVVAVDQVLSPSQVTDAYLLALAIHHGGRLVTLDRSISITTVPGASPHDLLILS